MLTCAFYTCTFWENFYMSSNNDIYGIKYILNIAVVYTLIIPY